MKTSGTQSDSVKQTETELAGDGRYASQSRKYWYHVSVFASFRK